MLAKTAQGSIRGGPTRASHLREVDTGDSDKIISTLSSHERNAEDDKADKSSSIPEDRAQHLVERLCSLGIHDENFSREDVLLDVGLFPMGTVKSGDLVEVAALRANVVLKDPSSPVAVPKVAGSAKSRRTGTDRPADPLVHATAAVREHMSPRTFTSKGSGMHIHDRKDLDPQKRYIFVVKEMSHEVKLKHHNLQVSRPIPTSEEYPRSSKLADLYKLQISLSSHIASVFGFKNRMQAIVSKVCDH